MRPALALLLLAFVLLSRPASAQVDRYLGRPIADVRLQLQGKPTFEAELADVLETRKGDTLSMARVRESIIHLMALSRFENVQVNAQESADGVVVTYDLVPLRTVHDIEFRGRLALGEDLLRSAVVDRFGASPPPGRRDDIIDTLESLYREHGFAKPTVRAQVINEPGTDRATMMFDIDAGARPRIGTIGFEGSGLTRDEVLRRLALKQGKPYDPSDVDQRKSALLDSLHGKGYYDANVDVASRPATGAETVDLTVTVTRGARVTIELTGDPVPADRRAELMPTEGEKAIDQDLLEDWSRNIEREFQKQGYQDARATFERYPSPDHAQLRIVFTVTRGRRFVIDKIDFAGNTFFDRTQLLEQLALPQGQIVVQRALTAGLTQIQSRYQLAGFLSVQVKPDTVVHASTPTEVRQAVTISITEGPRTIVRSVTFACDRPDGKCAVPDAVLQGTLRRKLDNIAYSVAPDAPFYPPYLDLVQQALLIEYLNQGYQLASVTLPPAETMISADGTRADIHILIHEGPQVVVDHILLVGNNRTKASTIRNELQVKPGDPLDLQKLTDSQQRLGALGLFRRVRVTQLQHGSEGKRDVLVIVEEAPATTIAWGGGLEGAKRLRASTTGGPAEPAIELAPRVGFDIGWRNLFGKNRTLSIQTGAAVRPNPQSTNVFGTGLWEYRVQALYQEPRLLHGAGNLVIGGGVEQTVQTSFAYNRRLARVEFTRPLPRHLTLYGRYSIERTDIFNRQVDIGQDVDIAIQRLYSPFLLSKVGSSLVRDTRNDPIDPTTGILASVEGTIAPRALGSEIGFAKMFTQLYWYRQLRPGLPPAGAPPPQTLPPNGRVVFAGGARLGLAKGYYAPVPDFVPISERFFSGNAVRGFIQDRLGTPATLSDQGFPKGGNAVVILNAEMRVSIVKDFGAVGFVDAGQVFQYVSDLKLREIRPGLGFGLRYKSPFGPIRLDLGFNPDRRVLLPGIPREPLTAFYLGIGQAF